jgi:predicted transcriptional regulator of viral defense system
MKETNTLYESLINRGKILSKKQIMNVFFEYDKNIKKNKAENLLKYFSRHNYLKRIFSGFYYINSHDERKSEFSKLGDKEVIFEVLNKLGIKWYLGLGSSLYSRGKTWQTPNQISIINNKFSGIKKIFGIKVKFFRIKENLIFGIKKARINYTDYFYSDPAKTYIDMVYFRETPALIKVKNTQKYLKRYPKWVGKR